MANYTHDNTVSRVMGESTRRNIETARIRIETEAIRFVRGWSERDGEEGGRLIRNRRAGSIRIRYSIRVNVTYAPKSLPLPPPLVLGRVGRHRGSIGGSLNRDS